MLRLHIHREIPAVGTDGMHQRGENSDLRQLLRGFPAMLLGIFLKVHVMEEPHNPPELLLPLPGLQEGGVLRGGEEGAPPPALLQGEVPPLAHQGLRVPLPAGVQEEEFLPRGGEGLLPAAADEGGGQVHLVGHQEPGALDDALFQAWGAGGHGRPGVHQERHHVH